MPPPVRRAPRQCAAVAAVMAAAIVTHAQAAERAPGCDWKAFPRPGGKKGPADGVGPMSFYTGDIDVDGDGLKDVFSSSCFSLMSFAAANHRSYSFFLDQTGQIERCERAGKRRDAAGFAYYRRVTNTYSRAGLGAVFRVAWKNLFQQSPEGFKRYAYCFVDAGGTFDTIAEAQAAPLPQSFGGFSFEQVLFQGCGGFSWSVFDMKKDQSETTEDAFPTHQMCLVKTRLEIP